MNFKSEDINKFLEKKKTLTRQKTLRQTYSKNSFFLLTLNSKFRKFLILVIESDKFQYSIRFFMILNILVFVVKYYDENEKDNILDNIRLEISYYLELACNIIFLFEMSIRIVAMGFILETKTFMREPFQILDFITTTGRSNFCLKIIFNFFY